MSAHAPRDAIDGLIQGCIGPAVGIRQVTALRIRAEREHWVVTLADGREAVLSRFKDGDRSTVNTSLPPCATARKCAWASELTAHGIPVPQTLGWCCQDQEAALLTTRIVTLPGRDDARVLAAQRLARLHRLTPAQLSPELRELVLASDPRMQRSTGTLMPPGAREDTAWCDRHAPLLRELQDLEESAPRLASAVLVHGDLVASNLLASEQGVVIIDWETLALGDPMWDLAILVASSQTWDAQRCDQEVAAYARDAPLEPVALDWHIRRWRCFWALRSLTREDPPAAMR